MRIERTQNRVTDPLSPRACGSGKSPLSRRWKLEVTGKLNGVPIVHWAYVEAQVS